MIPITIQEKTADHVASMLLKVQAIKLSAQKPFTWASGWKSPIYCDNRIALSYPEIRSQITQELVQAIHSNFSSASAIAGVATAGIAQGALVAQTMSLPFAYVRPKPKDHGMENLIEGRLAADHQVVVIEDLVSTGGSSLKAVDALRAAGINVLGMVSIFTYGFDIALKNFQDAKISLVSLSDYAHLLKCAVDQNYISQKDLDSLRAWSKDPANWKG